jgi:hypothetical protein
VIASKKLAILAKKEPTQSPEARSGTVLT